MRVARFSALIAAPVLSMSLAPAAALAQSPPGATAQTRPAQPGADAPPVGAALRFPRVMASVGLGHVSGDWSQGSNPLQAASVQWLAGRHFVMEGEFSRWSGDWNERSPGVAFTALQGQRSGYSGDMVFTGQLSAWSLGGNLLYRSAPRRVAWFAGGGPSLAHRTQMSIRSWEGCIAPAGPGFSGNSYCNFGPLIDNDAGSNHMALQAVAGADTTVVGPVRAYASLQLTTLPDVRLTAGVRLVALTQRGETDGERLASRVRNVQIARQAQAPRAAASATGKQVRVSLADGTRPRGTLISLSDTEVTVRRVAGDVRYPLDQVLLVETVHRKAAAGAAIGAIAATVLGYRGFCGGDEGSCPDAASEVGAIALVFGGLGAGTGALIGGLIDHSHASDHIVYAGRPAPSVRLTPVVTQKKAGVAVAVQW